MLTLSLHHCVKPGQHYLKVWSQPLTIDQYIGHTFFGVLACSYAINPHSNVSAVHYLDQLIISKGQL